MRPKYSRPYYYINNVTTKNTYNTEDNQESVTYPTNSDSTVPENVERISTNRIW